MPIFSCSKSWEKMILLGGNPIDPLNLNEIYDN